MFETEWIIAVAGLAFAAVALSIQYAISWGGGRKDHSVRAGSPARGVLFNFTLAMMPSHKETARLHLVKFGLGVAMHFGICVAIVKLLISLAAPSTELPYPRAVAAVLCASALCGLYLLVRRMLSPELRPMSSFDDYLSVSLVIALLVCAAFEGLGLVGRPVFYVCSAAVFFYMPLGKLRHVLFFFVARLDYGRRLGYRGTYPSKCDKVRPNV